MRDIAERLPEADRSTCLWSFLHFRYEDRGTLAATVHLPRAWFAVFLDFAGALALFIELLLTPETFFACGGSIMSVLLYDKYGSHFSVDLTWIAVTLMLVFPLTQSISSAFMRREGAIFQLAEFRSLLTNIYHAHACWDWAGSSGWFGRGEDGVSRESGGTGVKGKGLTALDKEHVEHVRALLHAIVHALQDLLLVPRRGRMRHIISCGQREMKQVIQAESKGRRQVVLLLARLLRATENLKAGGLPANEASRINQYVCNLTTTFEKLWAFKVYRTSIALRGITQITIYLMPAFYGPYYLHVARGEGKERNIGFACAFACLNACLLVSLWHLVRLLEDPFEDGATDNIRVKEEFRLCHDSFDNADHDRGNVWHDL